MLQFYDDRVLKFQKDRESLSKKVNFIYPLTRFILFIIVVASLIHISLTFCVVPTYIIIIAVFIFIFVSIFHYRDSKEFKIKSHLETINREAINRIKRDWNKINNINVECVGKDANYLMLLSLNLIGNNSFLNLLGTIKTKAGIDKFIEWITSIEYGKLIDMRQNIVKELASLIDFRQELYWLFHHLSLSQGDYKKLILWGKNDNSSKILPYKLTCILSFLTLFFLIFSWYSYFFLISSLVFISINIFLSIIYFGRCSKFIVELTDVCLKLDRYNNILKFLLAHRSQFDDKIFFKERFKKYLTPALRQMQKLQFWISWSDVRKSIFLYPLAQSIFLWDMHVYNALNRWKNKNGFYIKDWIDCLAELEVVASLASIPFENPNWCYPNLNTNATTVSFRQLGHPLLCETNRVCNDIEIGPNETFILATGSNMSGKSTLLRSVGINILLARTGISVCSEETTLPVIDLVTQFNIQDSLTEGISLFMAELNNIKSIVDKTKENHNKGILTLYLLDEILQGTNSRERHIAVVIIINQLLRLKTIGLVSTHDLDLANASQLKDFCRAVHFKESINTLNNKTIMKFDYKLYDGLSNTTNALELLKAIGLAT